MKDNLYSKTVRDSLERFIYENLCELTDKEIDQLANQLEDKYYSRAYDFED